MAFTLLACQEVEGMDSPNATPAASPFKRSHPERLKYFQSVCRKIVDRVWAPVSAKQLLEVVNSVPEYPKGENYARYLDLKYTYCVCKEG